MDPRHIPNVLSFLRMLLVVPVVLAMQRGLHAEALVLVAIAASTDAIDG